jgi:hypothetical protein
MDHEKIVSSTSGCTGPLRFLRERFCGLGVVAWILIRHGRATLGRIQENRWNDLGCLGKVSGEAELSLRNSHDALSHNSLRIELRQELRPLRHSSK